MGHGDGWLWLVVGMGLGLTGAEYNASFLQSITNLLDTLLDDYDKKLRPDYGGFFFSRALK